MSHFTPLNPMFIMYWVFFFMFAGNQRICRYSQSIPWLSGYQRGVLDMFTAKPPYWKRINHSHPLARGLVVYWLFNEGTGNKVNDLSGQGNEGTIDGALWTPGKDGWVLEFDGSDDCLEISLPPQITYAAPMTAVMRVKASVVHSLKGFLNIQYGSGNSGQIALAYFADAYNGLLVSRGWNANYGAKPSTAISQTAWNDIAIVSNGGNERLNLYVNGALNTADGNARLNEFGDNVVQLGQGIVDLHASCQIGFFCIYDRALSAEEIAWLHREPHAMCC